MVSICEDLHAYVPTASSEHTVEVPGESEQVKVTIDKFHHTLFGRPLDISRFAHHGLYVCFLSQLILGGDQLTAARVRGSKRVRSNSQRGCDRLEGLVPVVEDWHAKGCFLTVSSALVIPTLYSESS